MKNFFDKLSPEIHPRNQNQPWFKANLKDIKSCTFQQIYNTVVIHLVSQKTPALLSDFFNIGPYGNGCAYRSGDKRCSIGVLIPDENYNVILENKSIFFFLEKMFNCPVQENKELVTLLMDLQNLHDNRYDEPDFCIWVDGENLGTYVNLDSKKFQGLEKEYKVTNPFKS